MHLRRSRNFLIGLFVTVLAAFFSTQGQARDEYSEAAVKAAYLFHFCGYVEWPEARESLTIGVLEGRDIAAELKRLLSGRTIGGRIAHVREMQAKDNLDAIQVLYVGPDAMNSLASLALKARDRHVLLVSDFANGLEDGAIINFIETDRRIRFEISQRAADDAGIKLSSRLLSAALRLKRSLLIPPKAFALHGPTGRMPGDRLALLRLATPAWQ